MSLGGCCGVCEGACILTLPRPALLPPPPPPPQARRASCMSKPATTMQAPTPPPEKIQAAVIGGGIAGLTIAIGLIQRGIDTVIYERGRSFREIGAGIGFTPNAERAMRELDPRIHAAFKQVAVQNATDWFRWMDGASCCEDYTGPADADTLIHEMYLGERGFEGCHRADFLDKLVELLPENTVRFGKNLEAIVDNSKAAGEDEALELRFADGSSAAADVVIGCDGIRSRVRQLLFGAENAVSHPSYTQKYAFRGLIPMAKAKPILGQEKTETRHMYLGPNGHALTFPVAGGSLLNVVAFATDDKPWPHADKFTAPAEKQDAVNAFKDFNPTVRSIIDLLPDQLDKWAVFDTHDHPAPTFAKGRVCISGDAAHAAAPYHGAGAGFAIEDGAALAHLLSDANAKLAGSAKGKAQLVTRALEAYSAVRLERARWLVDSSRFLGVMYQWQDDEVRGDHEKCAQEIDWRSKRIWDYDIQQMLGQAEQAFKH